MSLCIRLLPCVHGRHLTRAPVHRSTGPPVHILTVLSVSVRCRIFTLYSKSLPLDLACRVWDVFCRDGEEFLFRTALGLLRLYQDVLTRMDFIHMAQFLTRLPDLIPAEQLFQHIAAVHMTSRNRKWTQVRASRAWRGGGCWRAPPAGVTPASAQVLQALQKDPDRGSPVLKR